MDGVNREGEPCVFLLINRSLQDLLLDDYLPFSAALSGCATALQPCVLEPATRAAHACRRTPYAYVCGPLDAPPARRLLERLRAEVFSPGGIETIQAVLQIERGLRLSWQAVPVAALQQLMTMLQHLYPNYASRVLVVNLPSYLAWFVRFVKGMLDEVTAAKIELIDGGVDGLRHYYATEGLPAYYRDLGAKVMNIT
jgi:hypothetical protein